MKINFESAGGGATYNAASVRANVQGEAIRLTDVVLCSPSYLAPVPCCSVTRESIRHGFTTSLDAADRQHTLLRQALRDQGVTCHDLPPDPDMPDLCFTRDIAVTTPWGLVALRPALAHRQREVDHLVHTVEQWTGPTAARIDTGHIEGGDVCIARPGLLIIGVSGERTDDDGANAFASRFEAEGWKVLRYHFDPHFLHLDTIFCMVGPNLALACTDVLCDSFLAALAAEGIRILPVTYKEARRLGCNVVAIDRTTVLANAATPRVSSMMRESGLHVVELEIDQFAKCGGGLHCLTMPLRRATATR